MIWPIGIAGCILFSWKMICIVVFLQFSSLFSLSPCLRSFNCSLGMPFQELKWKKSAKSYGVSGATCLIPNKKFLTSRICFWILVVIYFYTFIFADYLILVATQTLPASESIASFFVHEDHQTVLRKSALHSLAAMETVLRRLFFSVTFSAVTSVKQ